MLGKMGKMKNWLMIVAVIFTLSQVFTTERVQAITTDPPAFIGEIKILPYSFAPSGYALCDGTVLSIAQNTALFSLLGSSFGGDGKTTFALPDLRGASPTPGVNYYIYIASSGIFPSRP